MTRRMLAVLLLACGGDSKVDLRPATEAECPEGGVVLVKEGDDSIVCDGDVAPTPQTQQTRCDDFRVQIQSALESDIAGGHVANTTVACGDDGIASGRATFLDLSDQDIQRRISQYSNACSQLEECE
jgi:hypothetical protein